MTLMNASESADAVFDSWPAVMAEVHVEITRVARVALPDREPVQAVGLGRRHARQPEVRQSRECPRVRRVHLDDRGGTLGEKLQSCGTERRACRADARTAQPRRFEGKIEDDVPLRCRFRVAPRH